MICMCWRAVKQHLKWLWQALKVFFVWFITAAKVFFNTCQDLPFLFGLLSVLLWTFLINTPIGLCEGDSFESYCNCALVNNERYIVYIECVQSSRSDKKFGCLRVRSLDSFCPRTWNVLSSTQRPKATGNMYRVVRTKMYKYKSCHCVNVNICPLCFLWCLFNEMCLHQQPSAQSTFLVSAGFLLYGAVHRLLRVLVLSNERIE